MTMICPICGQSTQHDADATVVKCEYCLRSFQLEPQRSEQLGEATEKSLAANQARSIHESIQSNMEAARHTEEYAEEGRELQRSEQQEWSIIQIEAPPIAAYDLSNGRKCIGANLNYADAKKLKETINAALNAALTAERQRREQATERYCLAVEEHAETKMQLLSALADNKRLKEQWDLTNQDLQNTKQRELSALAAIENHNNKYKTLGTGNKTWLIKNADLSLLYEHDAEQFRRGWEAGNKAGLEVRQPLVGLLRSVHTWFMQQAPQHYNGCGLWIDVDDELAKYPRPNCILDVDSPTLPPQREEYLQCGCKNCRDALAKVKQ